MKPPYTLYYKLFFFYLLLNLSACGNSREFIAQKWQIQQLDVTDNKILEPFIFKVTPNIVQILEKLPKVFKKDKYNLMLSKFKSTVFTFEQKGRFVFQNDELVMNQGSWQVKKNNLILKSEKGEIINFTIITAEKTKLEISAKLNFHEVKLVLIPIENHE